MSEKPLDLVDRLSESEWNLQEWADACEMTDFIKNRYRAEGYRKLAKLIKEAETALRSYETALRRADELAEAVYMFSGLCIGPAPDFAETCEHDDCQNLRDARAAYKASKPDVFASTTEEVGGE